MVFPAVTALNGTLLGKREVLYIFSIDVHNLTSPLHRMRLIHSMSPRSGQMLIEEEATECWSWIPFRPVASTSFRHSRGASHPSKSILDSYVDFSRRPNQTVLTAFHSPCIRRSNLNCEVPGFNLSGNYIPDLNGGIFQDSLLSISCDGMSTFYNLHPDPN